MQVKKTVSGVKNVHVVHVITVLKTEVNNGMFRMWRRNGS